MKSTFFIALFLNLFFVQCGVYSFTGASIPAEANTFSVKYFSVNAPLADPNYGQILSESLKDLVLSQTRLDLDKSSGDLRFEGYISDYLVSTAAAQGDETAALNRLSITVNVTYYNSFNEENNFTSSFTRFADFDSNLNFDQVEDQLIDEINEQLIQDIFDRSFGNW